ncbi:hypothetical protein K1719_033440 [Acacia pycnantha]|nr:hypothetical protein K1719_033440 [Acacia pycnantha]
MPVRRQIPNFQVHVQHPFFNPDPLDYRMIWHQCAVLEAVGVISSNDLLILDMGLVSKLLCSRKCHWAIYVVLHMPHCEDYPYLHVNLIQEILFQYCDTWSFDASQRLFIENLGVPMEWLHEAMAIYYNYHGDLSKSLEHFLECANWQKAHTVFVTSVAHKLFLSAKHTEIWRIVISMEGHKSEIDNWVIGAGFYISFYLMRNSLQEDNCMTELDSLQSENATCQDFISDNESLAVWGSVTVDAVHKPVAFLILYHPLFMSTIRGKIIPHAVSWFTGEAIQGEEFGDLEGDEDEDIVEDDEGEEEDDEDKDD